jgi:hypothetical protein
MVLPFQGKAPFERFTVSPPWAAFKVAAVCGGFFSCRKHGKNCFIGVARAPVINHKSRPLVTSLKPF